MCKSSDSKILGKRLDSSQGFFPNRKGGITVTVKKCQSCKLVFSDPMPIPEKISDHYGVPPEDYWQDEYFELDENYFSLEIDWLKSIKNIEPGMKSLDIGAGLGKQMISLGRSGFDAYGIEPSKEFCEMAVRKLNISTEKLTVESVETASFPSETFDFISFGVVLEHIYDPNSAIQKALSWLKQDGLIHIEVPNSNWLISKIINMAYRVRGLDYVGNISPMHVPFHLYEFDLGSFIENGKLSNYEVLDYRYFVCPTYMPALIDPFCKWYMRYFKNTGMQLSVMLKKKA